MYKRIQQQEQLLNLYSQKLIDDGIVTKDEVQVIIKLLFIVVISSIKILESVLYD